MILNQTMIPQDRSEEKNKGKELAVSSTVRLLAAVPAEEVWLANFVSPRTRQTYKNAVGEFIAFMGISSAQELKELDQAHVIAWREALTRAGASHRTIRSRLSALSSMFNHLLEHQKATRNPTLGVKRPHVDDKRVQTPTTTPRQVRAMLSAPNLSNLLGLRDAALLHILFYCGCRISEVCSLKVKDFHEDGGYWVLDFRIKGGKQNRIAIHQECQNAIRQYLEASGHDQDRSAPLIQAARKDYRGQGISRLMAHKIFQKYAKKVKLPAGVTPHTARATFITQALEAGCPIEAVQASVGHSRIDTTRMYDQRGRKHRESASFAVRY